MIITRFSRSALLAHSGTGVKKPTERMENGLNAIFDPGIGERHQSGDELVQLRRRPRYKISGESRSNPGLYRIAKSEAELEATR